MSAVFRGGGGDPGKLSGALVEAYNTDNMNGVLTHFGFLFLKYSAGGRDPW